jgi:hypothetical protein
MVTLKSLVFGAATSDNVLASLSRTPDSVSFLWWHFPTTITAGRRTMGRGDGASYNNDVSWDFGVAGTLTVSLDRASGTASAVGNKVYTTGKWWCHGITFALGSAPKIYWGDETTPLAEETYASSSAGTSGSLKDDGGRAWAFGNLNDPSLNLAYQGRFALAARFRRELTLTEIRRWQFNPFADVDSDAFYLLGVDGTATQRNWSRVGIGGVVTGATVSASFPNNVHVGFGPPRPHALKPYPFSPATERRGARF